MKLIIDIPEKVIREEDYIGFFKCLSPKLYEVITNGKPLPKGHGDLIDASKIIFENADFDTYADYCRAFDAIDYAETIVEADKERGR